MERSIPYIFTHLREHVPLWILGLEEVSRASGRRRSRKDTSSPSLTTSESHTEIIHLENGELQKVVITSSSKTSENEQQNSSRGNSTQPLTSAPSNGAPPAKNNSYRARNAIMVNYDASSQKRLEEIVEGVAKVKDMIRRANKNAQNALRIYTQDDSETGKSEEEPDEEILLSQLRRRTAQLKTGAEQYQGNNVESEALQKVRRNLDRVQDLCNRCAFKLLRDGNCQAKTSQAIKALQAVLEVIRYGAATSRAEQIVEMLKASTDKLHYVPFQNGSYIHSKEEREDAPVPIKLTYRLNGYLGR